MDDTPQQWLDVPDRLQPLFLKYAATACSASLADPDSLDFTLETDELGPVLIKRATLFGPASQASLATQRLAGGPNPLTAALLGAALGGGLGYGSGWLMRKIMPEYFKDDLERTTGMAGALGGAGLAGLIHAPPNIKMKGWWDGLTTPSLLQDPTQPYPGMEVKSRDLGVSLEKLAIARGFRETPKYMDPEVYGVSGGAYVRDIPTDEWGQIIAPDPFLTPQEKAIAIGIPSAAALATGSRFVSPMDIAATTGHLATNAFAGKMMGKAFGMAIAPIFRLKPQAVNDLSRAGMLAGIVRTVGLV